MQDVSISIFLKPADGWIEMIPMEVTDKEVNFISAICNHFFPHVARILIIVKNENYVVDFQNESAVIPENKYLRAYESPFADVKAAIVTHPAK